MSKTESRDEKRQGGGRPIGRSWIGFLVGKSTAQKNIYAVFFQAYNLSFKCVKYLMKIVPESQSQVNLKTCVCDITLFT